MSAYWGGYGCERGRSRGRGGWGGRGRSGWHGHGWHDHDHEHRHHHHGRHRSRSSSVSSTSSSSSEEPISSLSSSDLHGVDIAHARLALSNFRIDPAKRTDLPLAVHTLKATLRSNRENPTSTRLLNPRTNKHELRAFKREFVNVIKNAKKDIKAVKKVEKGERREEKKEWRDFRRENKGLNREEKREVRERRRAEWRDRRAERRRGCERGGRDREGDGCRWSEQGLPGLGNGVGNMMLVQPVVGEVGVGPVGVGLVEERRVQGQVDGVVRVDVKEKV
jgi:hypothetical protein